MNQKYEFTGETMNHFGHTLHRIKALASFGDVKKGDIGGWIEAEKNLSESGDAWVSDDARVYGDAQVSGNAWVFDDAQVSGDAWVSDNAQVSGNARVYGHARVFGDALIYGEYDFIVIGPIGRRNDITTFYRIEQGGVGVKCGCFNGTIEEFERAIHKTHAGTIHERAYMAAIRMAKEIMIHD